MRVSNLWVLALPALAAAQEQAPLFEQAKGWFDQAASFVKSAAAKPGEAAAAKVAQETVTSLTYQNWKSEMQHSGSAKPYDPPEAWMVCVSGNKTCHGRCERLDKAWNEAATYMAADVSAPRLASIDCDKEELLCGAWGVHVGTIWFFLIPKPAADQSPAPTHINILTPNMTTITSTDIVHIHTRKLYMDEPRYEGALHPFDGWLAKYGLTDVLAYGLHYTSKVPSWAFMIVLSLFSRWFVSKRMPTAPPDSRTPEGRAHAAAARGNAPAAS